jgi:hypothetical protein
VGRGGSPAQVSAQDSNRAGCGCALRSRNPEPAKPHGPTWSAHRRTGCSEPVGTGHASAAARAPLRCTQPDPPRPSCACLVEARCPDSAHSPPRGPSYGRLLRMAAHRSEPGTVESTAPSPDNCSASCGHRVCTAFIGGSSRPEVQPRWRRSRYLPCGFPAIVGSGHSHGRVFRSAFGLTCVLCRATPGSSGDQHAVDAIASRAG